MTKEEITKFLFDNCYNEKKGVIDLSNLDFTMYNCGVDTSGMKVQHILNQGNQTAQEVLQDGCEAVIVSQNNHRAKLISQWGHRFERLNNYAVSRHDDVEENRFYEKITKC